MRDLLPDLDRWRRDREEIALATVVRVRGSAPRPPGARLAVTRSGRMTGSVSGGCVESDVFERAQAVIDTGEPVLVTYGPADEFGFGVGLACGGSIDVLIEAFEGAAGGQALRAALDAGRPATLAVALEPAELRARALVVTHAHERTETSGPDAVGPGDVAGSLAADLDAELVAALGPVARRAPALLALPWRGGQAEVFVESFAAPRSLYVVGASHTAIPLCRIAKELGFVVTVIDAREVFATAERFPEADALIREWPEAAFEKLVLDRDSHVVALTHDPKFDLPALALALRSEAGYIGALGSRQTNARRLEQLRELGFDDAELARIRTPVGLDIGGSTPEEVALSIVAEMVAVRRGRDGRPLRERDAPIHDD